MEPLPALYLSCTIFRFLVFVDNLLSDTSDIYIVSFGNDPPLVSQRLQETRSQLSSLVTHLQDGISKLHKEKSQLHDERYATLEKYAFVCTQDCANLLRAVEILVHDEYKGPKYEKSFSALLGQIVSQDAMESIKVSIDGLSSFVIPRMHLLARECIRHMQDQLDDITKYFGTYVGTKLSVFQELPQSISHLNDWLNTVPSSQDDQPKAWEEFCYDLTQLWINTQDLQNATPILYRLDYDERLLRHARISEAHEGTFTWVFDQQDATGTSDPSKALRRWLTSDQNLFWVTGRPGSGKSTLIKFIADHTDTLRLLKEWAGYRESLVISHYFDILGTSTHNSLKGLLRSLTYGILSAKPDLIAKIVPVRSMVSSVQSQWTVSELKSMLRRIIKVAALTINICFFIDGLDEYQGDHLDICQQIVGLAQLPFVKICVSSRSLAVFQSSLIRLPGAEIYLHELTHADISKYIRSRLQRDIVLDNNLSPRPSHSLLNDLSEGVADKAQGVFLWAVFATQLLFHRVQRVEDIPYELENLVKLVLESVDSPCHEKMAGNLTIARDVRQALPAELFFFHDMEYGDDLFAFREPSELLPLDRKEIQKLYTVVHQRFTQTCKGLLEVNGGKVVFMHRIVSELMHTPRISGLLREKIRKNFDLDLSLFRASVAWLKRARFKSGEFIDLQPESTALSLAYLERLSEFHERHGNTLPDLQYVSDQPVDLYSMSKAVKIRGGFDNVCKHEAWADVVNDLGYNKEALSSVSKPLKSIYKRWLYMYEEHLRQKRLEEQDPMEEILDLVENLRQILRIARRCDCCDQEGLGAAAVTWALLDNVEESLLAMTARGQFDMSNLSMVRGIYRHLVIEAGIERYIKNKLLLPEYFDNQYSQQYRSPLCSALGVAPRFLTPAQPSSSSPKRWLLEKLLELGHDPNKTYRGETPWTAFIGACVPDITPSRLLPLEGPGISLVDEISDLMLRHGAYPDAYVEILGYQSRTWRVPVWFKLLKLAPCVQTIEQDTFERVFSHMLDQTSTLSNTQALLKHESKDSEPQWIPFSFWTMCKHNFELSKLPSHNRHGAEFVFKIFTKVCDKISNNSIALEWARYYFADCFWPDHSDFQERILIFAPGGDSITVGLTNSSFTPGENTESHQVATSATSSEHAEEAVEVEPEKGDDADHSEEPDKADENVDDVASIQSIDDDIQSIFSSIARTPHTIAAERQVGALLARHPDVRFILEESTGIMPKDRLKRNIRRSLKLLYLQLRENAQNNVQVQVLTTRMLRGRGSRTRISERTVDEGWAGLVYNSGFDEEDIRPNFHKDRSFLDDWLSHLQPSEKSDEKPEDVRVPNETLDGSDDNWQFHVQPSEKSDERPEDVQVPNEILDESDDNTSAESSVSGQFQAVQFAEDFLMNGSAFQTFLTHLGLSLLPDHLRQIMHLAAWDDIELIDMPFSVSILDRIKSFIENLTGSPWNWWPMSPPRAPLRRGHVRMNWKCHCGKASWTDITPSEARIVERIANNPASFVNNHYRSHNRQSAFGSIANWFTWKSGTILPTSMRNIQNNLLSLPNTNAGANNQAQGVTTIATQNGDQSTATPDLIILFGVPMGPKTLHVIPIPVDQQSESKVFPLLQTEYKRIRGRLRAWFSFWQLSHCNFVKFESITRNIVVACGQDLPEADNTDYDYTPKPPQASIPPVHPHIFEAAFNSCAGGKCQHFLPFHECYEFEETIYIKRIPKKKTPLTSGEKDIPIWGLEARHCISCFHVVLYHLLILVPPFALWAFWMSGHPDDIQSASVPMTVVLAMISMFWSATGIVKQFRGEL